MIIQNALFCPLIQNYVNRQETIQITRMDYDKIHK